MTLRVLYRLYGEAEADHDFVSSTTATSVYETFLLTVVCKHILYSFTLLAMASGSCFMLSFTFLPMQAETLRSSFPSSDKSLNRLLCEVPYLPKSIFDLLEDLCCPGASNKDDKFNAERVRQGLGIVWSLIYLRPPTRDGCLEIALKVSSFVSYSIRSFFSSVISFFAFLVYIVRNFPLVF